ncbi:MAG: ribonuclease III [Candidatus Komeilibacteria bacterium]|nr:ribonuclease III [Candidatus Komeilibacteria bacterium]
MKDLKKLQKNLGVDFKDADLLKSALIHRSYLNENKNFPLDHNERLEFLGDAVLELITTEYLYNNFPNPEGELTNWRASLVNAKMLAEIAHSLEIEDYLHLSKGEAQDNNLKARNYILANALEALIGAIFLDKGLEEAKKFISRNILSKLPFILENQLYVDPKSKFQEKSQEIYNITPIYKVMEESGPDHNKFFKVGVYLNEEFVAAGTGSSKQEAQVAAADNALTEKGW